MTQVYSIASFRQESLFATLQTTVDFSGNSLPADWHVESQVNNGSISNERMEAVQTISLMRVSHDVNDTLNSINFTWDGRVIDSQWGSYANFEVHFNNNKLIV